MSTLPQFEVSNIFFSPSVSTQRSLIRCPTNPYISAGGRHKLTRTVKVDGENAFKTFKNGSTKTTFSCFSKATLVFLPYTKLSREIRKDQLSRSWSWSGGKPVFSIYFTGWVKVENTFKMKKKRVFLPCTASRMLPVPPKTFSLDSDMST